MFFSNNIIKSHEVKRALKQPEDENKIGYLISVIILIISFYFFMEISNIPIPIVLSIYSFFVDDLPVYYAAYSLLGLYFFIKEPSFGKGIMAIVLSIGLINFLFIHIYADNYSLETVKINFFQPEIKQNKIKLWTYDSHWNVG